MRPKRSPTDEAAQSYVEAYKAIKDTKARLKVLESQLAHAEKALLVDMRANNSDSLELEGIGFLLMDYKYSVSLDQTKRERAMDWIVNQPGGQDLPKLTVMPMTLRSWAISLIDELSDKQGIAWVEDAGSNGVMISTTPTITFKEEKA